MSVVKQGYGVPAGLGLTDSDVRQASEARRGLVWSASLGAHLIALSGLVLVPLLARAPLPDPHRPIGVVFRNAPPPPPFPEPLGALAVPTRQRQRVVAQPSTAPTPEPTLTVALEVPRTDEPPHPEVGIPEDLAFGSPTGHELGVPEGMEGGVLGGDYGGVPGGEEGGCAGCTGDGPVVRVPDEPPRLVHRTKPAYPETAFAQRIEGVVVVGYRIDREGRVQDVDVIESVPLLDDAAIACVRQWRFRPAIHRGHPVATYAKSPVTFRIF